MEKASHKNINAIIIIGTDDSTIFKLASTLNKPCVLINSVDRDRVLDSVSPDHRAIGFTTMQYLFEQGHRRVLTITCLRRDTLYARLDGIKEAYRHFHVAFEPQRDLLVTEWFTAEEAERELDAWLLRHDRAQWPEVIFPNSTSMTEGVLKALQRHGLRVPEDISAVGYDGIPLAKMMIPSLTTYHQDTQAIGYWAADRLVSLIEHPKTTLPESILIPGSLLEGASVRRI